MSKLHLTSQMADLIKNRRLSVECQGLIIDMQLNAALDELYLDTPVFEGGDFIPESVRRVIPGGHLKLHDGYDSASLYIDEARKCILLAFGTAFDAHDVRAFESAVADFATLAHEWRYLLEDHGQQDLVYVTASK